MRYEKCKKYFKGCNYTPAIQSVLIGLVLICAIFIKDSYEVVVIGLLFIIVGVVFFIKERNNAVTDREYDREVSKKLHNMEQRALEKLGLDEDEVNEIAPIVFHGYRYKGTDYAKQGKDGLWRTNKYEVVVMYFSHNEVHCYKYMFTTTSKQQSESTDIYFYRDIVSVSTASESVKFQDEFISYEAFRLTTTGGTALSVSLQDADDAQRSINAMRQLIREKKQ